MLHLTPFLVAARHGAAWHPPSSGVKNAQEAAHLPPESHTKRPLKGMARHVWRLRFGAQVIASQDGELETLPQADDLHVLFHLHLHLHLKTHEEHVMSMSCHECLRLGQLQCQTHRRLQVRLPSKHFHSFCASVKATGLTWLRSSASRGEKALAAFGGSVPALNK